jgi:large subunit ribosomal protein L6
MRDGISLEMVDGKVELKRATEEKAHKAMHGLYRSLIANMVKGVSEGYKVEQELVGVGYRAANTGQMLELTLGYSHNISLELPKEVKVVTLTERGKNPTITMTSHDKQLLGQVAAKIRSLRPPEPYKGKGIKFVGEQLRRKAGKSAGK